MFLFRVFKSSSRYFRATMNILHWFQAPYAYSVPYPPFSPSSIISAPICTNLDFSRPNRRTDPFWKSWRRKKKPIKKKKRLSSRTQPQPVRDEHVKQSDGSVPYLSQMAGRTISLSLPSQQKASLQVMTKPTIQPSFCRQTDLRLDSLP